MASRYPSQSSSVLQQHGGVPSRTAPAKLTDEELLRLNPRELLTRVRQMEGENIRLMSEHSCLIKDVNQRMQIYLGEIRSLKDVNHRLQEDNQELRDLCCFLDDDRQKGRKLAREWQKFGRYTASVMRQEVSTYQTKLRELESRQQELIKDNLELKELCLYLDEERAGRTLLCLHCGLPVTQRLRDEGDGSSSSTNNDEIPVSMYLTTGPIRSSSQECLLEDTLQRQRSVINEQVLQYIRNLENRIQQLEDEKSQQNSQRAVTEIEKPDSKPLHPPPYRKPPCPTLEPSKKRETSSNRNFGYGKPEAVVYAMKVLEVHEQLDKLSPSDNDELAEGEKALVREMCNVVWRKLEDDPEKQ